MKTKREEFNKVNSSYNRLKKIADDLRAESKRPTSKEDWKEGVTAYYRDHLKARGNKICMKNDYDEVVSALDKAQYKQQRDQDKHKLDSENNTRKIKKTPTHSCQVADATTERATKA